MAAAGKLTTHFFPHILTSRSSRAPFSINISGRINGLFARAQRASLSDAPSCIFVGPVETASKETLEALYRQVYFLSVSFCLYDFVCFDFFTHIFKSGMY